MTTGSALDLRITIQRAQSGGRVPIATVWASRTDISDAERMAVGNGWVLTSRFVIRHGGDAVQVRPNDFVVHDGKSFQVQLVKLTRHGRKRFLEITAKG